MGVSRTALLRPPCGADRIVVTRWVVAIIVLLAACTATMPEVPSTSPVEACRADLRQQLDRFVGAFNAGDARGAAAAFSRSRDEFQWFSVGGFGLPHMVLYRQDQIEQYVADRHARGEHLSLIELRFSGEPTNWGGQGIGFEMLREAPDLLRRSDGTLPSAVGKGAFDCPSGTFIVWSMGALD